MQQLERRGLVVLELRIKRNCHVSQANDKGEVAQVGHKAVVDAQVDQEVVLQQVGNAMESVDRVQGTVLDNKVEDQHFGQGKDERVVLVHAHNKRSLFFLIVILNDNDSSGEVDVVGNEQRKRHGVHEPVAQNGRHSVVIQSGDVGQGQSTFLQLGHVVLEHLVDALVVLCRHQGHVEVQEVSGFHSKLQVVQRHGGGQGVSQAVVELQCGDAHTVCPFQNCLVAMAGSTIHSFKLMGGGAS